MSLTSPPDEVTILNTMVTSTATWATLTGATTWYPSIPVGGSIAAISPPYALYEPTERNPRAIAPGLFLINGKINLILYIKTTSAADIENVARKLVYDLEQLQTGLPIIETHVGLASEADTSFDANQAYHDAQADGVTASTRNIVITITYGITN